MKKIFNLITIFMILTISIFAAKEDFYTTSSWVKKNLETKNLLILDARGGKTDFLKGHIPGAVLTSWPAFANMADKPSTNPIWGTLLEKEALQTSLQEVGLNSDSTVVVYTDPDKSFGEDARILWMLKYVGFKDVKILDGGLKAWKAENNKTQKLSKSVKKGNFVITEFKKDLIISTEELENSLDQVSILDTREVAEYNGEKNYGESKNGRIPGSKNIFFKNFLDENGSLKSKAEIDALIKESGLDTSKPVVSYCTGGIRSSLGWLALVAYDYKAINYDASFAGWTLADKPLEK